MTYKQIASMREFTQFLFDLNETMTEMLKQVQHDVLKNIESNLNSSPFALRFQRKNLFQGLNYKSVIGSLVQQSLNLTEQ